MVYTRWNITKNTNRLQRTSNKLSHKHANKLAKHTPKHYAPTYHLKPILPYLKRERPELSPRLVGLDDAPAADRRHRQPECLAGLLELPPPRGSRGRIRFPRRLGIVGAADEEPGVQGDPLLGVKSEVAPGAVERPPGHLVRHGAFCVNLMYGWGCFQRALVQSSPERCSYSGQRPERRLGKY